MKPRSIVMDILGGYVRYDGGEIPLRAVTELMSVFDVPESTTRVLLNRMRQEGWLAARKVGRSTIYSLPDTTWRLLETSHRRIFERRWDPWDHQWRMVIYGVPETSRPARDRIRKILVGFGFGPLAPSTWITPHDNLAEVGQFLADEQPAQLDLLVARSMGPEADLDIARRCWDLTWLHKSLSKYVRTCQAQLARYRVAPPTGARAFRERTALAVEYSQFPARDPDLPLELLPAGSVRKEAHELFIEAYELLREPAEAFYREVVHGIAGRLAAG